MIAGTVVGASSPLVGSMAMETLASALGARGVTTLTAAAPPELDDWLDELDTAVRPNAATPPVVLLGFSAAAPRLPAAAARIDAEALVFLDARLPVDGASPVDGEPQFRELLDRASTPGGTVLPWSQWWGDELLAALITDYDLRRRFADECPALPRALFDAPLLRHRSPARAAT